MNCLACNSKINQGEELTCKYYHYKCLNITVNTYTVTKHNCVCPSYTMGARCIKGDKTPTRGQFEQCPTKTDDNLTSNCASNSGTGAGVIGSLSTTYAKIYNSYEHLEAILST